MIRPISYAMLVLFSVAATRAADSVELHSVIIEDGNVIVEYSKNFDTCAHLYRFSDLIPYPGVIVHYQNLFCESGDHVVSINPESSFRLLQVGDTVHLVHGNNIGISSGVVVVTNRPLADAGADQTMGCLGGALVQLDGTASSDPNGDTLSYQWSVPSTVLLDDPTSPAPQGLFPDGTTLVTLTVTDENGASDSDDVLITVYDDTPPEVSCTTDFASLAPANHKMVPVQVSILATDFCDAPEVLELVAVSLDSSEPDDAIGSSDGKTTGDTNGFDGYNAPVDVVDFFQFNAETGSFEGVIYLRAEADKKSPGRTYSIRATVTDSSGNEADTSCTVVVPGSGHKGSKKK